jgi:hypothetical protein
VLHSGEFSSLIFGKTNRKLSLFPFNHNSRRLSQHRIIVSRCDAGENEKFKQKKLFGCGNFRFSSLYHPALTQYLMSQYGAILISRRLRFFGANICDGTLATLRGDESFFRGMK